jgi:MerR family transcriptional regulator, light-induced transcriptional regulator
VPTPDSLPIAGLTTTQLAQRTGVPAATLRMWETRHGFPAPARLAGGHRRYGELDVELVRAVVRRREEGLSLTAAIARTLAGETAMAESIFAGLAQRRPDLQTMTVAKPAMLALSRAIEDDACVRAGAGVLVGSFQTERFYRQSERRWCELARTATIAVALADFTALRERARRPVEVPVSRDLPLAREWAVVVHAPGASACLAGWEIPQPTVPVDSDRRFEMLWSPEPEVALAAIAVAAELIAPLAPRTSRALASAAAEPVAASSPELRAAARQAHRMLSYLAGGVSDLGGRPR